MKKVVRTLAFAVAVMGLTVACHNNKPAEEVVDSVVEEVVEEVIDTTPVEEVVEEVAEATPAAQPTKKAAKKEVKKEEKKVDENKLSITVKKPNTETKTNEDGSVSVKAGKAKIEIK